MTVEPYFQQDGITIYHGDCREILPSIAVPQAIVTDPPYGLGDLLERPGHGKWEKLYFEGAPEWDKEAPEVVVTFPQLTDHLIIWGGNYFPLPPMRGWLIWDKIVRDFSSGHCELAWTTLDQPTRAFNYSHGQLASEGKYHPTQKPLPLMKWCIGVLPPEVRIVTDPFMGSGTTLRAAKDMGLQAVGIDQDEKYCEIAAKRMAQAMFLFPGEEQ